MKFFYILMNQFVSIYLSANTVTTLHFDSPINFCDKGPNDSVLEIKFRRKRTSISLIPRMDNIDSNMTCYMKDSKIYVFNLKWSDKKIHKNIVVKQATKNRGGTLVLETDSFKLYDAGRNFIIRNKTATKILVNERLVDREGFVSKWSPVVVNGKEYDL